MSHEGVWGSLCDDLFDDTAASVVCRQLGYGEGKAKAVLGGAYGQGTGPILLDNVRCDGTEADIRDCQHNMWHQHNCDHCEDAGVVCCNRGSTIVHIPK